MKLSIFILICFPPVFASAFCLQTFNTYGPIYASRLSERVQDLGNELKKEAPCEIIHFQEVWNKGHQDKIESILSYLPGLLILNPSRVQKVGLISATVNPVNHPFLGIYQNNKSGLLDEVRGMAGVKKGFYILPSYYQGEKFIYVNTHLHPSSSAVRLAQLIELLQARLRYPDYNIVLSGDFNFDPNHLEYQFVNVVMGLRDAHLEYRKSYSGICTYCKDNPQSWLSEDKIFDYVFYSRNNSNSHALVVREAKVNLRGDSGRPLSDHYGVRIDWNWENLKPVEPGQVESRLQFAKVVIDQTVNYLNQENPATYEDSIMALYQFRDDLERRRENSALFKILNKYY